MDTCEFRRSCLQLIDYIIHYLDSLHLRSVTPTVTGEDIKSAFPPTAPGNGESFEKIMEDIEKYIMPGIIHWQHPGFYGFFPSCCSFPAILSIMFADSLGHVGFHWNLAPSGSELETIVLDWFGKIIGLPDAFLRYTFRSRGGAVIKLSTTECIFVSMITARQYKLKEFCDKNPSMSPAVFLSSLVVYCTKELASWITNCAKLVEVNVKILGTDENFRLRGETVKLAIKEDIEAGSIPFFTCIALGSRSGVCDPIDEIGPICKQYGIWLHVHAPYAGTAMICPEYKHFLKGIEYAQSFNVDPSMWMLMHVDCAVLFVQDIFKLIESASVDRTKLGYSFAEKDWFYPCGGSEFRAMKLWFVMRIYGVEGLQKHIRNHTHLAKLFKENVKKDERFEIIISEFGVVCFRLVGSDELNKYLLNVINSSGKIFMTPCELNDRFILRFVVCTERANERDIMYAWNLICKCAEEVLREGETTAKKQSSEIPTIQKIWLP